MQFIQLFLRKGAHMVVYGLFGLIAAFSLGSKGLWRWVGAGFLVALVAVLDEWHQTSVPGRTGCALDVLVDTAGFLLFAAVAGVCRLVNRGWRF